MAMMLAGAVHLDFNRRVLANFLFVDITGKRMIIACMAASLLLAACGGTTATSPSTVTVTQPTSAVAAPPPVTTSAAPSQITIPDLTGQNAEIAQKKLEDLGLTDVSLPSANPKYSMVLLARNWTVVSVEAAPGTVVKANDLVIVKVTKE
jgi:hypothetical protein